MYHPIKVKGEMNLTIIQSNIYQLQVLLVSHFLLVHVVFPQGERKGTPDFWEKKFARPKNKTWGKRKLFFPLYNISWCCFLEFILTYVFIRLNYRTFINYLMNYSNSTNHCINKWINDFKILEFEKPISQENQKIILIF